VLHDVSIDVGEGEFVSIVGPNGAGKTTLFKTLSGTVPAMSGSVHFSAYDLLALPPHRRPHLGIAHVPEGRQVFPSLSVLENLEMGAYTEAGRRAWKKNLKRIYAWLPVLAERAAQPAGTLSTSLRWGSPLPSPISSSSG
jgi:branched-chain amino acid transport system ATP-binding protein